MPGFLRVRNFDRFQHYKDRSPPWIKLYYDLLTDYRFACLQDASKLHLVLIWLLASRTDNRIPDDPKWVARSIHATEEVDLNCLVSSGFLERCDTVGTNPNGASNVLAGCNRNAMPETEAEAEGEKAPNGALAASAAEPDRTGESPAKAAGSQPAPNAGKPASTRKVAGRKPKTPKLGNDPKPEHAEVRAYFCEQWKARRSADGADYAWKHGRDDRHLKWILDQCGRDPDKAKAIVRVFIDDDDAWIAEKGHDIALLVSGFNRYRARKTDRGGGDEPTAYPTDEEVESLLSRSGLGPGGGSNGCP